MSMPHSRSLSLVLSSLLVAACNPPIQGIVGPDRPPAPAASVAPTPAAVASLNQVAIRVSVAGVPLEGASVTIRSVGDLAVLADGFTTDSAGRLRVPVGEKLAPGSVVLVQASKDVTAVSGLFLIPGTGLSVQAVGTDDAWLVDLASSIAARRLTSKLAEVVLSAPAEGGSEAIQSVLDQTRQLVDETRKALSGPLTDNRAAAAWEKAKGEPSKGNLESLANALIRFTSLQGSFIRAVDACNRQVMANLAAGGALVAPALWQIVDVQVRPPQFSVLGSGELEVAYDGEKVSVKVADATLALAAARTRATATTSNPEFADVNTTFVENVSTGGGGGGSQPAVNTGLPLPSEVVFVSARDGNNEIYGMATDGTLTNLTNNAAADDSPQFSPDGTKIVFRSDRDDPVTHTYDIYVMDADGTNVIRLTMDVGNEGTPQWSPDGTKIAYTGQIAADLNKPDVFVMNADGTGQTNIVNTIGTDQRPRWSPDGTKIQFQTLRTGTEDIMIRDADGSNEVDLAPGPAIQDFDPMWSPDGSKIVFASNRDGNNEIYVMDSDGSNQTRITNSPGSDRSPVWSPDGTKILFRSNRDDGALTVFEFYVINADGSGETRLTNDTTQDTSGTYSPDGTRIIFVSERNGNKELYVMNADGTNQSRLTNHAADDTAPVWMP